MNYEVQPYEPCPCGSGAKYKFCCAAKAKGNRHGKFPVGTVALYGPDDKVTTKIAASVVLREGDGPAHLERFVATDVTRDPKVAERVKALFARHGVKTVVVTAGNLGCPHEEGLDFPAGKDCPFCPFWAGKQGTARRDNLQKVDRKIQIVDPAEDIAADDDEAEEDYPEPIDPDEGQDAIDRVDALLGDAAGSMDAALDVLLAHLRANLQMPCEVTGSEDFRWEEPYVLGGWSPAEYKRLKKTQPSYRDRYQLLSLSRDDSSEWMMFYEDIAARVRRVTDGKIFVLGLAELNATDRKSPNYQLIYDFGVWFVNSR